MHQGNGLVSKRVCMIVQEHYPKDVRVRKEAQSLLARGHKVWVIAVRAHDEPKQEIINGVSVYRVGMPKQRGGVLRYFIEYAVFFLAAMFRLNVLDIKERSHAGRAHGSDFEGSA